MENERPKEEAHEHHETDPDKLLAESGGEHHAEAWWQSFLLLKSVLLSRKMMFKTITNRYRSLILSYHVCWCYSNCLVLSGIDDLLVLCDG